jgi:hypothetical protein
LRRSSGNLGGPTRAPLVLGTIAASLQALEIERLLRGRLDESIVGIEHYSDLASRAAVTSRLCHNPRCRFDHAHGPGEIIGDLTVGELVAKVPGAKSIAVQGQRFARSLGCPDCGADSGLAWRLVREVRREAAACPACGRTLQVTGIDIEDALAVEVLDAELAVRPLSALGIREGDLLLVDGPNGYVLFERRSEAFPDLPGLPRTVIVVGLGNIGSNLVDLLVRSPSPLVERLVLVDPDFYERGNLAGQRIDACDLGQPKAMVQARHAKKWKPILSVVAYVSALEDVPVGVFRGSVVASCLDSRASRQALAEIAWRVGAPLVDAAVSADIPAVRVAGYMAGPGRACLECSFLHEDYAALEQVLSCSGAA